MRLSRRRATFVSQRGYEFFFKFNILRVFSQINKRKQKKRGGALLLGLAKSIYYILKFRCRGCNIVGVKEGSTL